MMPSNGPDDGSRESLLLEEIGLEEGRSATCAMFYARLRVYKRYADVPLCVRNVSTHFAHTNTRKAADVAFERDFFYNWPLFTSLTSFTSLHLQFTIYIYNLHLTNAAVRRRHEDFARTCARK